MTPDNYCKMNAPQINGKQSGFIVEVAEYWDRMEVSLGTDADYQNRLINSHFTETHFFEIEADGTLGVSIARPDDIDNRIYCMWLAIKEKFPSHPAVVATAAARAIEEQEKRREQEDVLAGLKAMLEQPFIDEFNRHAIINNLARDYGIDSRMAESVLQSATETMRAKLLEAVNVAVEDVGDFEFDFLADLSFGAWLFHVEWDSLVHSVKQSMSPAGGQNVMDFKKAHGRFMGVWICRKEPFEGGGLADYGTWADYQARSLDAEWIPLLYDGTLDLDIYGDGPNLDDWTKWKFISFHFRTRYLENAFVSKTWHRLQYGKEA